MSRLTEVIDSYHEILQGGEFTRAQEILQRGNEAESLVFDGRAVCDVLRPRFITAKTHKEVQRAATAVVRAMTSICRHAAGDEALRRTVGMPEWQEPILEIDGRTKVPSVVGRLDGLLDPDGLIQFIEYNANPGGMIHTARLAAIFRQLPVMQTLGQRHAMRAPDASACFRDALMEIGRRLGRSAAPGVAVIGFVGAGDQAELGLIMRFMEDQGVRVKAVGAEEEWALRGDQLFAGDFQADLIIFSSPQTAGNFLMEHGFAHPMIQAVQAEKACIINGLFRSALFSSKLMFAALSDPAFRQLMEPEVGAMIHRHIPWTRTIRETKTPYEDRTIDLLPFVAEHRQHFVLKPGHGQGGSGVVLGWKCTQEEWSAAIQRHLDPENPGVVQKRVEIARERFPIVREGRLVLEERYMDLNPYIWNDERADGYLVRVARDALLNVSSGEGSVLPLFLLEEA